MLFLHPKYEATSKLYVTSRTDSAVNLSDLQIGTYLTSDYQEVFRTWEVHEQVLRNLGLDYSYTTLNDMVSVTNPSDTRLLNITVTSEDPVEATNMANEYANVACDYIYQVMGTEEPRLFSESAAADLARFAEQNAQHHPWRPAWRPAPGGRLRRALHSRRQDQDVG